MPWEEALARHQTACSKVIVNSLPCHFGYLETNLPTGLPPTDGSSIDGVAVGSHIIDADRDKVAATQLAVDGEVEQGQVARAAFQLNLARMDHTWPNRNGGFGPVSSAFVPRLSGRSRI